MAVADIAQLLALCPVHSRLYATKNVFADAALHAERQHSGQWEVRGAGSVTPRRLAEMVQGLAWAVSTPQYGGT